MTTRVRFTQAAISRAIRAAEGAGKTVTRTEILPDGRIVLFHEKVPDENDHFGAWKAKREGQAKGHQ